MVEIGFEGMLIIIDFDCGWEVRFIFIVSVDCRIVLVKC